MTGRLTVVPAAGVAAVFVAGIACAQDSISAAGGLPGDALDAYRTAGPSFQVRDYVVDLAPITSSWGRRYAVGPVAKASRSAAGATTFNHLLGAQAASNRFGQGPVIRPSYLAWAAAGQGINPLANAPPTDDGTGRFGPIDTSSLHASRFGVAFMEFGAGPDAVFGSGDDENSIIAAAVAFQARRLDRLLVSRVVAAANRAGPAAGSASTGSFGLGAVDESGIVHLLADGQATVAPDRLRNRCLVRVAAPARDAGVVNVLRHAAGAAAADDAGGTSIVFESGSSSATVLSTPSMIPASIAGRPVMFAADFASNYVHEVGPGATVPTRAHLPGPGASTRGNVSYTAGAFAPLAAGAGAGTGALLMRAAGDARTRAVAFFSLRPDGSVGAVRQALLPAAAGGIVDPTDGFDPAVAFPTGAAHEFTSYQSQVPFRGGNGQVALVVLPGGDLLGAALVSASGGGGTLPQSPHGYIAVVRISAATGVEAWTIAAHTGDAAGAAGGRSKAILGDFGPDGVPGTGDPGEEDGEVDAAPIGRIALRSEVFPASLGGPSLSAPAVDRAGNIYFLATVALNAAGGPLADRTVALLRANLDQAAGGYRLELLARSGDIIAGPNSRRHYRLELPGPADLDSADSGAPWSGSIVQDLLPGVDGASIAYGDPASLGALVVRARAVYDANGDGQFVDPSGPGAGGPDEAYNVALLLMPSFRPGDFNRDGVVNPTDVAVFVNRWFTELGGGWIADWDGDGAVLPADVAAFVTDWVGSL
jgi:hypothetical protein